MKHNICFCRKITSLPHREIYDQKNGMRDKRGQADHGEKYTVTHQKQTEKIRPHRDHRFQKQSFGYRDIIYISQGQQLGIFVIFFPVNSKLFTHNFIFI